MGVARKSRLLTVASIAGLFASIQPQVYAEDWVPAFSQIGSLSQARSSPASAAANGKIVVAGGYVGSGTVSSVADIYDIASNTWTTANLSLARTGLVATSAGNKILFAGGRNSNETSIYDRVDIYDTTSNTWSTASLSQPRTALSATAVGDKVYFAGGFNAGGNSSAVDVYDTSTNNWSTLDLTVPRASIAATSVGTRAVFAKGYTDGYTGFTQVFNTASNTWSQTTLPTATTAAVAVSDGTYAYIAGGNSSSNITIYNPAANTVVGSVGLPTTGGIMSGASTGNKLLFGGTTDRRAFFPAPTNPVDIYDIASGTWATGRLPTGRTDLTAIAWGPNVYFAGGEGASNTRSAEVDRYVPQNYTTITSTQNFTLGDTTTVAGRMQLDGGSLNLSGQRLTVGSMSGVAQISFNLDSTGMGPRGSINVGSDNTSTTYSGTLSGVPTLTKVGTGMLTLAGTSTATLGNSFINAGTLQIASAATLPGAVTVASGARLSGAGKVGTNNSSSPVLIQSGAILSPGDADGTLPGTMTVAGNGTLMAGSHLEFDLNTPFDSDSILAIGTLNVSGLQFSDFVFDLGPNFTPNSTYVLASASAVTGLLGTLKTGTLNGWNARITPGGPSQTQLVLVVAPEPGTMTLVGVAGTLTLLRRRARRQ